MQNIELYLDKYIARLRKMCISFIFARYLLSASIFSLFEEFYLLGAKGIKFTEF